MSAPVPTLRRPQRRNTLGAMLVELGAAQAGPAVRAEIDGLRRLLAAKDAQIAALRARLIAEVKRTRQAQARASRLHKRQHEAETA